MPFILLEATCYWCVLPLQIESWTLSFCLSGHTPLLRMTDREQTFSFTHHRFFTVQQTCWKTLGVWQTSDIPYLTSGSCRQNYFWHYCWFIKDKMPFSCSLLVASDKITSLPYSWFIMDKVPFPSFLLEAADKWLPTLFLVYYGQSTIPLLTYGSCNQSYFSPILV
jgi:hypothetical protein